MVSGAKPPVVCQVNAMPRTLGCAPRYTMKRDVRFSKMQALPAPPGLTGGLSGSGSSRGSLGLSAAAALDAVGCASIAQGTFGLPALHAPSTSDLPFVHTSKAREWKYCLRRSQLAL